MKEIKRFVQSFDSDKGEAMLLSNKWGMISISVARTILAQHEEIERLKLERDSVCHLNDDLSAELNQLRERCNGS